MSFTTIAAVSTPAGKGGVALLRISGTEALSVAEKVFFPKSKKSIADYPPRMQIYGDIVDFHQNVLDDGLLTYFVAPASFTGEDVVEIACHGGEIITSMILSSILENGAVLASPGEFSRRSFMNGKMSLTAAEGIADLLDAKTEEAALLSSKTARGKLSLEITGISDRLLAVSSSLWAYLDYPEEDLQALTDEEMVESLELLLADCQRLLNSFQTGRAINSGVSAVIVGKPNAGKSTFFNRLLGEERAIVTSIPGTTRDLIEYPVKLGRVLVNLSDTAGVREAASDRVEEIGIERAIGAVKDAELVFVLFDRSRPLEDEDRLVLKEVLAKDGGVVVPILTKSDLPAVLDLSELPFDLDSYFVSDSEKCDFSSLVERIEKAFISDEAALREGRILTNARQKSDLVKGMTLVSEAVNQIQSGLKDVASLTLEAALGAFLEIDGKSAGEKILDEVFSRFCIGK